MPRARGRAVVAVAEALASGLVSLDPGADRDEVETRMLELPGIGPWTTAYLRMRALNDPDTFLPTDLGVRRGLEALGVAGDPNTARTLAESWRPWRSYAVHHLWNNEETS
jgi:AraC family transcriptional regulator of adaptative response / DNA-3-methyladenine glycosylase II